MPKFILIKTRVTRIKDLEVSNGLLEVSHHTSVSNALEELVYDPDCDWIIIEAKPSTSYSATVKVVRKRDKSKVNR